MYDLIVLNGMETGHSHYYYAPPSNGISNYYHVSVNSFEMGWRHVKAWIDEANPCFYREGHPIFCTFERQSKHLGLSFARQLDTTK